MHIELGREIEEHLCECCGRPVRSGEGFVDDGRDLSARYWFDMASHGNARGTRMLVVLDRTRRGRRFRPAVSFVVHGHVDAGGVAFSLQNPSESPVRAPRHVTGRTLDPGHARGHTRLPVLWAIVDTVVEQDPALAAFLSMGDEPG